MKFLCRPVKVLAKVANFAMRSVQVQHDRYDGTTTPEFERVVFDRGDSVAILMHDRATDEVIVVEQFRVGVAANPAGDHPWILEPVAGSMDGDAQESPEDVARREVAEEAPGCVVQRVASVGWIYPSPGGCSEKKYLFLAEIDSSGAAGHGGLADHHEDIRVVRLRTTEAFDLLDQGGIHCASLAILLSALRERLRHKRS